MSNCELVIIFFVVSFVVFIFGGLYFLLNSTEKPTEEIHYVWRNIYPEYVNDWNKGKCTLVYVDPKNNWIRGKVVKTDDGLYLATMWNGATQEFIYENDATKSVENYKPRVYK
jgi:hypothetical protein